MSTLANRILPKLSAGAMKKSTFVSKLRLALETLHLLTRASKYKCEGVHRHIRVSIRSGDCLTEFFCLYEKLLHDPEPYLSIS